MNLNIAATYSFSFQEDGIMDDNSVNVYAKLSVPMPALTRFTVCTWIKFHFERTFMTAWSYCVDVPVSESSTATAVKCSQLDFEKKSLTLKIAETSSNIDTTGMMRLFNWNLICGSYKTQGESRLVTTIYVNGVKVKTALEDTALNSNQIHGGGAFILGQDQDEVGGGFEKQQSLSGEISMLNIWDRLLTDLEVSRMAKCYDAPFGNVLNWNNTEWTASMVNKQPTETSDFCSELPPKNYQMFPERRSLEAGQQLCVKVGKIDLESTTSTYSPNRVKCFAANFMPPG